MSENKSTSPGQKYQVTAGEKIGRWVVLDATRDSGKRVLCRCECGTEKRVYQPSLRCGGSLSCGCGRREAVRYKDLSGQSFGCVTVLSHAGSKNGNSLWNCVCECGNAMILSAASLKQAARAECSCKRDRVDASIPIGSRFGRWTVVEPSIVGRVKVRCQCECGTVSNIAKSSLKCGDSNSCGCLRRDSIHLSGLFKHGMKHTQEYNIWCNMKGRCFDKNNSSYPRYGGRGITVCDRWKSSFTNFLEDMGAAPEGHSIDRKNNNLGYSPENCRWATKSEQARNRRSSVFVDYKGERRLLVEIAEEAGIPYLVAYKRIKRGWTAEQATSIPVDNTHGFRLPK